MGMPVGWWPPGPGVTFNSVLNGDLLPCYRAALTMIVSRITSGLASIASAAKGSHLLWACAPLEHGGNTTQHTTDKKACG